MSPYHYCFRAIVESCALSVAKEEKAHLFMSTQAQYEPYAVDLYQAILDRKPTFPFCKHLDASITYASPSCYQQLQAADLAAYRIRRIAEKRRSDPEYEGTQKEQRFLSLRHEREDLKFAAAATIDQQCTKYALLRKKTDGIAHLKHNRQRVQISHDPRECRVIGKVDAAGNYRVVDRNT